MTVILRCLFDFLGSTISVVAFREPGPLAQVAFPQLVYILDRYFVTFYTDKTLLFLSILVTYDFTFYPKHE